MDKIFKKIDNVSIIHCERPLIKKSDEEIHLFLCIASDLVPAMYNSFEKNKEVSEFLNQVYLSYLELAFRN